MAMLAEPRRKVKWSLNPRGKLWSEDSNKFGQRMLEKMGWSAGKGLGAHEQGTTSHIGVKLKTDNRGVGYGGKDIDWCKHQTKFDQVLADLGQNMEAVGNETTITSLEKISKQSKSRLHYHKFTRGKDLTQYSKKDLDCILGISNKGDEVPLEEQTVTEDPGARDDSFGVVTVLGGSMEDYLKKKKWHSRTISGNILSESVGCCDGSTEGKNGLSLETVEENNLPCDRECDQDVRAKKKKSKKKDLSESVGCCDGSTEGKKGLCIERVEENNLLCDRECDQDVSEKIKKKRSKKKDFSESVSCCDGSTEGKKELCIETVEENNLPCDRESDQDVGEKIRKKKSKKKALSKSVDFPTEGNKELCIETVEENNLSCGRECEQEVNEKPKKKRSKKKYSSESVGCFDRSTEGKKGLCIKTVEENNFSCGRECEQDIGEKIRKKKSKKKSRVELDNVDGELSVVVSQDEPISKDPKNKSKRKRRHSMTDISNDKDNSQKLEKDEFKSLSEKVGKSKKSRCAKEYECDDPKQLCENMSIVKYFKCFDKKDSLETSLPSSIQMFHGSNLGEIKGYGCEITS